MIVSRRDGGDARGEGRYYHRRGLAFSGPETQLAAAVVPPACDGTGGSEATGVEATRGEGNDAAAEARDVDRHRTVVAGRAASPIPQLTEVVAPPALNTRLRGDDTGLFVSSSDGRDAASEPYHIRHCRAGISTRSVPQPTVGIDSPALGAARCGQGTGVGAPSFDGSDSAGQPHHGRGSESASGGCISQLAVQVSAPAHKAAGCGERAGVEVAGCGSGDATREPEHVYWR